jgi:hypothetical protein
MPELIRCPHCSRQLQLPESLMGQEVQCPSCGAAFVASAGPQVTAPRPPQPPPSPPGGPEYPPPRPRREYRDDYDRQDDYGGDDWDRGRPRRRSYGYDMPPHRGSTVLTLGILGLVFSLCPLVGFIFGLIALIQGNSDLASMDSGRMDPEGRGQTTAGRTCGMIAVILSGIFFVLGIMLQLSNRRFR